LEEYLRKKYADEAVAQRHFGDGGEDISDEITQQTLLPGIKDPSLWMVKCRLGEEKCTVLQLMRKAIAYANNNDPLQIKSVIAPEGIKGYIYIEAYKQTHVKQVLIVQFPQVHCGTLDQNYDLLGDRGDRKFEDGNV